MLATRKGGVLVMSIVLFTFGSSVARSDGMCEGYHQLLANYQTQKSVPADATINPVLQRGYEMVRTAKCDLCHGIDGVRSTEEGFGVGAPMIAGQRVTYTRAALRAYAAGAYWLYKVEDEGVVIDAITLNLDMYIMPRFSQDGERIMNGAIKELPGWKEEPAERDVKRLLDPEAVTAVATWYACGPDGKSLFE